MRVYLSKSIVFLSVFILLANILVAQNGDTSSNPFELPERLEELEKEAQSKEKEALKEKEKVDWSNPFEVKHNEEVEVKEKPREEVFNPKVAPIPTDKPNASSLPNINLDVPRGSVISHFWLGGIFLFLMALLAFFNTVFGTELRDSFRAFTNSNILSLLHRERKDSSQGYFVLFYLFYVINMGVFLFLAAHHLNLLKGSAGIVILFLFVLLVGVLIFLRHSLLNILRGIFPFGKELGLFSYMISIYNQVIGLLIIPFNVGLAFAPESVKLPLLYLAGGMILAVYIYRSIRGLIIANKFLAFHKFHFFIYLCTVEIAPIVVLVKLVTTWGTIV